MFEPSDIFDDLDSAIDRSFFAPLRRPRTRRVGVELELPVWNRKSGAATGDELSFDCSFNTLELSFGPDEDLTAVHRRFLAYYPALQDAFGRREHLYRLGKGESIESIAGDYGALAPKEAANA